MPNPGTWSFWVQQAQIQERTKSKMANSNHGETVVITTNRYDHRIDQLDQIDHGKPMVRYVPQSVFDLQGQPSKATSLELQRVSGSPNARHPGDWHTNYGTWQEPNLLQMLGSYWDRFGNPVSALSEIG